MAAEVNAQAAAAGQPPKSVDEIAMGFLRVANETMCRPIRALTQMKVGGEKKGIHELKWGAVWNYAVKQHMLPGFVTLSAPLPCAAFSSANAWLKFPCIALPVQGYDVTQHVLSCFGGAGGQHACAIAAALGMRSIFIHRYSGILSAVGIGLAEVVQEAQVRMDGQEKGKWACTLQDAVETQCDSHAVPALLPPDPPGRSALLQEPSAATLGADALPDLERRLDALQELAVARLRKKASTQAASATAAAAGQPPAAPCLALMQTGLSQRILQSAAQAPFPPASLSRTPMPIHHHRGSATSRSAASAS